MEKTTFVTYSKVLRKINLSLHPSDWGDKGINDYLQSLSKHLFKMGTQKYMLNPHKCSLEAKEEVVKLHFEELHKLTKEDQDDLGFVRLYLDVSLEQGFFEFETKLPVDNSSWKSWILK